MPPLLLRLRGGGGDGGVYPLTHAEMQWMTPSGMGGGSRPGAGLNGTIGGAGYTHQWADRVTEAERRLDRSTTCAASSHPLRAPIVVCGLGYLYNKEDLIEKMLSKTLPAELSHLRSLKDVCDATLHANPQWKPDGEGHRSGADEDEVPFHCPIASVPMNGRNKFAFLRASGHVVSERALAQLGGKTCPVTEQPLGPDDVVPLNGTDEQRAELAEKMEAKKAAQKEAKEARRKGKAAAAAAGGAAASSAAASSAAGAGDADDGAGATAAAAPARPPKDRASAAARAAAAPSVGAAAGKAPAKRGREWETAPQPAVGGSTAAKAAAAVAQKSEASAVYKSMFMTKEDREREAEKDAKNYAARGIPMNLNWL